MAVALRRQVVAGQAQIGDGKLNKVEEQETKDCLGGDERCAS